MSPDAPRDFHVLPISIPPWPSLPKGGVIHHLFFRRNAPAIPTAGDSRSLFVANVPVDSTEPHFRALFSSLVGTGRFESISFEGDCLATNNFDQLSDAQPAQALRLPLHQTGSRKRRHNASDAEDVAEGQQKGEDEAARLPRTWPRPLRRSGGSAVVMLADDKSVEQVLRAIAKVHQSRNFPPWGERLASVPTPGFGSAWLRAHMRSSYPDRSAVQTAVDAFSVSFARREREAAKLARRLRNEPDEDGFVTVTRAAAGGRTAPATRAEAEEARQRLAGREERKKRELHDFYRFQLRERRKAEQANLQRQFEDDRKTVAAMRENRTKFRPEE